MIDKMVLLAADSKFKARLKIVRYEDLVTYPEQIGLEIFEFLDIPDSDKVIDELKRAAEVNLAQESWKLNHWLWDLKWDDVNRLQTLCPAAFKTLGYSNELSPRTAAPFEPEDKFWNFRFVYLKYPKLIKFRQKRLNITWKTAAENPLKISDLGHFWPFMVFFGLCQSNSQLILPHRHGLRRQVPVRRFSLAQ